MRETSGVNPHQFIFPFTFCGVRPFYQKWLFFPRPSGSAPFCWFLAKKESPALFPGKDQLELGWGSRLRNQEGGSCQELL